MFIYFWDRQRAWTGKGQRKRETQNPKRAPGSELSAQSPTRSSNPQTVRSWPEQKSDAQTTELPRRPSRFFSSPKWNDSLLGQLCWDIKWVQAPRLFLDRCHLLASGLWETARHLTLCGALCPDGPNAVHLCLMTNLSCSTVVARDWWQYVHTFTPG